MGIQLLNLYLKLAGGVLLGLVLGWTLPPSAPAYLGQFLFWVGVPAGIVAFLRGADLSGSIWIAPVAAWAAILLGAGLAWAWVKLEGKAKSWSNASQGSFLLASMVGNTGYLGYPVTLALVGDKYFAWALFYDMLGTLLGAYGLGVALAARFGTGTGSHWQLAVAMLQNPALWSFGFGLAFRDLPLPALAERGLLAFAWTALALSLVLIGMRLSQLSSRRSLRPAFLSLGIKMLLVPLVLGAGLPLVGVTGSARLAIALQMAMPPAFATLVLAEVYNLDRDLAVTALAVGCAGLLLLLPVWLWLFGV
ncbi:AEC family transporter [Kamptonema formosum]|uniref:AEC family transporter n=1 Tax=Kamptonema formosum TaxID=331992 RepID=UPI00034651F7|nr:AEC family transporter [Oscillatoria sp. PCC 10802]